MENLALNASAILFIGIGATIVMDLWGLARKPLFGVATPNYCIVGRWLAHMAKGKFSHHSMAAAAPISAECHIGWLAHYLIGISYAALLVILFGSSWLEQPQAGPAVSIGLATLVAPFCLMQPGMGAGFASSKASNPSAARFHSVVTHLVFGLGMYWAALLFGFVTRT